MSPSLPRSNFTGHISAEWLIEIVQFCRIIFSSEKEVDCIFFGILVWGDGQNFGAQNTGVLWIGHHPFVTVTHLTNVSFYHLAWRHVTSPQFFPEVSYFLQISCMYILGGFENGECQRMKINIRITKIPVKLPNLDVCYVLDLLGDVWHGPHFGMSDSVPDQETGHLLYPGNS